MDCDQRAEQRVYIPSPGVEDFLNNRAGVDAKNLKASSVTCTVDPSHYNGLQQHLDFRDLRYLRTD
jgi:hypothetical protein